MKLYLQMLLQDNFIHADLHPGNVLVKEVDPASRSGISRWLSQMFDVRPNVILLDTGMVAELNPADQQNLVAFFRALTQQDGEQVARMMLAMSEIHTCKVRHLASGWRRSVSAMTDEHPHAVLPCALSLFNFISTPCCLCIYQHFVLRLIG